MQGLNFQVDAGPLQRIPLVTTEIQRQKTIGGLVEVIQFAYRQNGHELIAAANFLEDLIDACVMECYFREHMLGRDLLFLEQLAPHVSAYDSSANESQQRDFLTHLHRALNAPRHPIRNQLIRLAADSPDLLAVIKSEGRV